MTWRVCRICVGICNGKHEPMVAHFELAEQRCRWSNDLGYRCSLAAPHGGAWHFNIEAPESHRRWAFGVDEAGRLEQKRYPTRGRRAKKVEAIV